MTRPKEVFLSHATSDREAATGLALNLREHGIPVWFSQTDLRGAQDWHDEIGSALRRCDFFIVLLSASSVTSEWVKREVYYALRTPRYHGRILPVLLEPCDYESLSWTLGGMQMIPAADLTAILRIWGLGLRRSAAGPLESAAAYRATTRAYGPRCTAGPPSSSSSQTESYATPRSGNSTPRSK